MPKKRGSIFGMVNAEAQKPKTFRIAAFYAQKFPDAQKISG